MSAAEPPPSRRAGLGWVLALVGLFVAAFVLRLVGFKTGLPYVYNADENSHFVPRAIGMFGHSLNPEYFINPPAFTYFIHARVRGPLGDRSGVGGRRVRGRSDGGVRAGPAGPPRSSARSPFR